MNKFWIVMGDGGRPGWKPYFRHSSEEEAFAESHRLAHLIPGVSFFVMESKGVSTNSGVTTTKFGVAGCQH